MIYFEVHLCEHDKWMKNHEYKTRKFKTLKEASLYATREKLNYWKTCIVRKNTNNDFDYNIYEEISHGKWRRIL